jgi:hypothetical protein
MTPCTILLTAPTNLLWRGNRIVGDAGELFTIDDGQRFRSEFDVSAPNSRLSSPNALTFMILGDTEAADLIAERDRQLEANRQKALHLANEAAQAAADQAERDARRDALVALVRAAVPSPESLMES